MEEQQRKEAQQGAALRQRLAEQISLWGGSAWGVADLSCRQQELIEEYGPVWQDYPRAISVAGFFPKDVIGQLLAAPTHTYQAYYDIVNAKLNDIALRITQLLEAEGWRAFPIPASQRVGQYKQSAIFSHRLAAAQAGIGWIGKNLSLIHPQVGPRLRLVTVLTDAPLPVDRPMASQCPPDCTKCRDICPAQAIKGVAYQPHQPIEERFDFMACAAYLRQVRQSFGKEICGKCLAVCPWGAGAKKKNS